MNTIREHLISILWKIFEEGRVVKQLLIKYLFICVNKISIYFHTSQNTQSRHKWVKYFVWSPRQSDWVDTVWLWFRQTSELWKMHCKFYVHLIFIVLSRSIIRESISGGGNNRIVLQNNTLLPELFIWKISQRRDCNCWLNSFFFWIINSSCMLIMANERQLTNCFNDFMQIRALAAQVVWASEKVAWRGLISYAHYE